MLNLMTEGKCMCVCVCVHTHIYMYTYYNGCGVMWNGFTWLKLQASGEFMNMVMNIHVPYKK